MTETGFLLVVLKVCLGDGFGVALEADLVGAGVALFAVTAPSTTVTLIFWPGLMLLMVTELFDDPLALLGGVISNGFFAGAADGAGAGDVLTLGELVWEGFGVGDGEGFGVADGVGFTVADGDGEGFGVGETVGVGLALGVGAGVTLGVGVGVALGVGLGVTLGVGAGGVGAGGAGVGAGGVGAGGAGGAGVKTAAKVTVSGADVALAKLASPAFVAVAKHVPSVVAVKSPCELIEQPVAVPSITAKVTEPVPLPPVVYVETGVPTVPDVPLRTKVA